MSMVQDIIDQQDREIERLRLEFTHSARTCEMLQADNERLRGLLEFCVDNLECGMVGHEPHEYHQWNEPCPVMDRLRAALRTDQPTVTEKKCNCDDHDARYCVNRISRTEPCKCKCHGANAIAAL